MAFIQYSRQFTFPIIQTASIVNVLQSAVASAERVFELLDEPEEIADPVAPAVLGRAARRAWPSRTSSFRYEPEQAADRATSTSSWTPGETVAIVGPTGAGKTTLVNLLMRFYELDGGRITIDGIDTRELTRDDLRRPFGMVLQDTWLFHGTIRENIAYGRLEATEAEIVAAAEAAHVDHFVRTLPDGYDTVIDDDATNVSAGEKQLLTIARAFLADPPILILDEATSSVDTRTEVLIQRAMARLMRGRTTFVIAHRLSTIRDADTILVMDRGSIVEQGTHDELLDAPRLLLRALQQPVRGAARRGGLRFGGGGRTIVGMLTLRRDADIHDIDGGWFRARWHFSFDTLPRPGERQLRRDARLQRRSADPGRRVAAPSAPRRRGADLRRRGHVRPPGQRRRTVRAAAGRVGPAHDAGLGRAALGAERLARRSRCASSRSGSCPTPPSLPPGVEQRVFTTEDRTDRLLQGDRAGGRRRGQGPPGRVGPCGAAGGRASR